MLCPNIRTYGICTVETCRKFHPNFICKPCAVTTKTQEWFNSHLRGRRHAETMKAPLTDSQVRLLEQDRAQRDGTLVEQAPPVDNQNAFDCPVCEMRISNQTRIQHEQTPLHKSRAGLISIQETLDEAERDKYGVTVSPTEAEAYDLGVNEQGKASLEIFVKVDNLQSRIILRTATLSNGAKRHSSFELMIPTERMLSTSHLKGTVNFDSQGNRGRFYDRVVLVFYDIVNRRRFAIVRSVSIIVGNKEDHEALKPIAPYVAEPMGHKLPVEEKDVTDGVRPAALADINWVIKLPHYKIPKVLMKVLGIGLERDTVGRLRSGIISHELSFETHAKRFHSLLHTEEYRSMLDIQRYDTEDAELTPGDDRLYYLEVPGLTEKRPSLIVGDQILAREQGSFEHGWWRGYVHVVELDSVGLHFNASFAPIRGQAFDVRFELNRLTLRRMHQALDVGVESPRLLFPQTDNIKSPRPSEDDISSLNPINRSVGQNYFQQLAVTAIRDLQPGSPPFVVFGPPGTGKTMTVIEAIRQILLTNPRARILACAPSNSAADILAERLTVLGSELFRLYAPSRLASLLPTALQPFSRRNDFGTFAVPSKLELSKFRVIVSTCLSASVPYGIGLPAGHFSHIFVDEAGQACEPEALIAIKPLANSETNIILSGDPKQLGPVVRSNPASKLGLGKSLLDRLTAMAIYDDKEQRGVTIVKLTQNFRSHPAILAFPNEQFYQGELECKADPVLINSMLRASCIVKPGFPVVFHSIAGKDAREARSPSFFNIDEASLVKKYIKDLKTDQRLRLTDEQIGVVTPYHAQAGKIRKLVWPFAKGVKIGSVEDFQGQERRVIIVSTVRSDLKWVEKDIKQVLGFVANNRRFNVAMTRAQALLIVIGDPNVLSLDPTWRSFLNYIYNNGGWTGKPTPYWNTKDKHLDTADLLRARQAALSEEEQELIAKITETIEGVANSGATDDIGDGREAIERPWARAE